MTGRMIREIRQSRKMSQAILAHQIGVRQQKISRWETGKNRDVESKYLLRIARALKVDVKRLLEG